MVMDYVEGQTLADYIRRTSSLGNVPSPTEIVQLFTSIGLAVDYAHQQGMIHRDLKPANILLDGQTRTRNPMGEPILTDFGLAKLLESPSSTLTAIQLGTPLYIAPEQVTGYAGNERSDIYSLGIILYEMVTGTLPFQGDSPTAVIHRHLRVRHPLHAHQSEHSTCAGNGHFALPCKGPGGTLPQRLITGCRNRRSPERTGTGKPGQTCIPYGR